MNNWLERVKNEKRELDDKIVKLSAFMQTVPTENDNISDHMLWLLGEQLYVMKKYSQILSERIKESEKR